MIVQDYHEELGLSDEISVEFFKFLNDSWWGRVGVVGKNEAVAKSHRDGMKKLMIESSNHNPLPSYVGMIIPFITYIMNILD